ncbi:MAG: hypothetical protein Q4B28_05120 [bacterium]|nr:hypothetical protein [bacterium]
MRGDGNTEFLMKMEDQFIQFPNGKHDDIIDNIAQAFKYFKKGERGREEERYEGVFNINRNSELY